MSSQLKQTENTITDDAMNEADIAAYLHQHPDFFQRHTRFLEKQQITHQNIGSASSLIERQVAVLREKNNHLEEDFDGKLMSDFSGQVIDAKKYGIINDR